MSNFLVKNGDKAEWGIPEGYPYDGRITLDLSKRYTEEEIQSVELLYDNTFIKLYDNVLTEADMNTMKVFQGATDLSQVGMSFPYKKNEDGIYVISIDYGSVASPMLLSVPADNAIEAKPGLYIYMESYGGNLLMVYGEIKRMDEKYMPESFIITSSTEGSTKRFKITVDDSGTISATEITT